jgi:small conductance mechanosensitive channel
MTVLPGGILMLAPQKRAWGILLLLAMSFILWPAAPSARAQSALLTAASSTTTPEPSSATAATEEAAASHLQVTAILRSGGVDLEWNSDLPNVTQFRVERSDHGANDWTEVKTVPSNVANLRDPQVKTTQTDYRVVALDKDGHTIDTSAIVSPLKKNLLNIFNGGIVTLKDMQDFQFWQDSVNKIVLGTLSFIPKLVAALILFGIFWVFYRLVRRIILGSMSRAHVDSSIRDMLGAMLRWSIMGFALVIACDQIGIQIAALLTGVSIIGLAIGFAAQETLANFIAGVVIFWDKPFKVGDWIMIDGMYGKVLRVSFRSTRMLNLNGETIVMPNTYMLSNRVANHSTHPYIRVEIPIGIAYKESIDSARAALLAMVHGDDRICKDPVPTVVVAACADSSVNLIVRLWIHDESIEQSLFYEYLEKAKKALDAASIEIPFPHMQLFLENTPAIKSLRQSPLQPQDS